jgi:hypothetical protein
MPGVDYERLVFWEELADDTHIISAYRAPEWLDRERLKTILVALDPEDLPIGLVIDDIVEGVATCIYCYWFEYRRNVSNTGPSKKLCNLHNALSEWLDEYMDDREGYHIHKGDSQKKDALVQLMRETGNSSHLWNTKSPRVRRVRKSTQEQRF